LFQTLAGKQECLASIAVSLFPYSAVPSGKTRCVRRDDKESPWDLSEIAVEDGKSQQTGYIIEDE